MPGFQGSFGSANQLEREVYVTATIPGSNEKIHLIAEEAFFV